MKQANGFTLVECLAGLVVASVLTAASGALLLAGLRLARSESATRAVRHGVRAGAAVLRSELSHVVAAEGDLVAVSESSITIRALRGFGALCARPSASRVVLDDSLLSLLRTVDPDRDSVRWLVAGDPLSASDDRWVRAGVSWAGRGDCDNGSTGTALTLSGPLVDAQLAQTESGAPLRLYEQVQYRSYRDGIGQWMLGVRSARAGGGWDASSPIAGPLPARGLALRALDAAGAETTVPESAATVEFVLRAVSVVLLHDGSRPIDSLESRVAVVGVPR